MTFYPGQHVFVKEDITYEHVGVSAPNPTGLYLSAGSQVTYVVSTGPEGCVVAVNREPIYLPEAWLSETPLVEEK